jgi:Uma2 family endonuclease
MLESTLMSTPRASTYLDAIAHLPAGGTLILGDVTWEEYESLVGLVGDHSPVRMSYDQGRLEVMSPTRRHDHFAIMCTRLAHVISDETGCELEGIGSATLKEQLLDKGVEPDACFYVQNAYRITGSLELDLRKDPPPDVAVEIDISHGSTTKFAIYGALRIPEIWRYDGRTGQMHIYHLTDDGYVEAPNSRAFPMLTSATLTDFLEKGKKEGQTATLRTFRKWLRDRVSQ